MNLIDRKAVFMRYPKIGALIRSFQTMGFDPEVDNPDGECYDAMLLPESEIDFANYILMRLHRGDIRTYPACLAEALKDLLKALRCDQLFILAHVKNDLFGNPKFRDKALLRVRDKLQAHIGRSSYQEGLSLDCSDLEDLIDIFFWLSRLDPDLPEYLFWVDKAQRFCFFICRYGNLHLLSLSGATLISEDKLKELGFRIGEDYDQFA